MRSLRTVLVNDYRLNLCAWHLSSVIGMSDDGLTILGTGTNPDGNYEAWIARLPANAP